MGIRIPELLEGILEATAAEATAKARVAALRAALEDEARRRYAAEGAAPSWQAPKLGKVRLDPPGDWTARVADPVAFGSWVAENYPTEATATITVPAAQLEAALEALTFAAVNVDESRVDVRPAWAAPWLEALDVIVAETADTEDGDVDRTITVVDPDTGAIVDGLDASRAPARLVVTLDRDRRTAAITEAKATAGALLEAAATGEDGGPNLALLDERRRALEGLNTVTLGILARAHRLTSSGTKAELAERIARAEQATGRVIDTASTIAEPMSDRAASAIAGLVLADADLRGTPPIATPYASAEDRIPYVGEGADGARRSAQIDREEADGLPDGSEDYYDRLASADRWDEQAARLAKVPTGPNPITALEVASTAESLRRACRTRGLSATGNKQDLARRLANAGVTPAAVNVGA